MVVHFQSLKSPYKFLKGIGVSFFHFTKPIFGNIFCNIQHFLDFSCRQKRISLEEFRRWYIWEFKSLISWRIFSLDLNIWGTGIDSIHSKHISLHLCYSELMNDEWSHAFWMCILLFHHDIMIFIVFLLKLFVLIHFCHWKEKREHHSSFILNESIHLHCDVCYREWKIIDARKRTHIAIQFECLLSLVLSTVFQQMTINERSPFKTIISSSWCRILFERIDSWNPFSYFIPNKE